MTTNNTVEVSSGLFEGMTEAYAKRQLWMIQDLKVAFSSESDIWAKLDEVEELINSKILYK